MRVRWEMEEGRLEGEARMRTHRKEVRLYPQHWGEPLLSKKKT